MKKILLLIALAIIISPENTLSPPKGDCAPGEVNRCTMGSCSSTLVYCPEVYEDGKFIDSGCRNQTTCTWNCYCVKKGQ